MLGRHRVTVLVFENRQAGSQRGGSSRGGGGGVRFPTWPPAPSVVLNDSLGGTDGGGFRGSDLHSLRTHVPAPLLAGTLAILTAAKGRASPERWPVSLGAPVSITGRERPPCVAT